MALQEALTTSMPRDDDAGVMQILSPAVAGTVHLVATEAADDSAALPSNTEVVRIACTGAVYLAFGGSSVDAAVDQTDSFIFTGGVEFFHLRDDSYIWVAARSLSGEGDLAVTATKME